jgi:hypothetical protein
MRAIGPPARTQALAAPSVTSGALDQITHRFAIIIGSKARLLAPVTRYRALLLLLGQSLGEAKAEPNQRDHRHSQKEFSEHGASVARPKRQIKRPWSIANYCDATFMVRCEFYYNR